MEPVPRWYNGTTITNSEQQTEVFFRANKLTSGPDRTSKMIRLRLVRIYRALDFACFY